MVVVTVEMVAIALLETVLEVVEVLVVTVEMVEMVLNQFLLTLLLGTEEEVVVVDAVDLVTMVVVAAELVFWVKVQVEQLE